MPTDSEVKHSSCKLFPLWLLHKILVFDKLRCLPILKHVFWGDMPFFFSLHCVVKLPILKWCAILVKPFGWRFRAWFLNLTFVTLFCIKIFIFIFISSVKLFWLSLWSLVNCFLLHWNLEPFKQGFSSFF